jgi:hypothetical protein
LADFYVAEDNLLVPQIERLVGSHFYSCLDWGGCYALDILRIFRIVFKVVVLNLQRSQDENDIQRILGWGLGKTIFRRPALLKLVMVAGEIDTFLECEASPLTASRDTLLYYCSPCSSSVSEDKSTIWIPPYCRNFRWQPLPTYRPPYAGDGHLNCSYPNSNARAGFQIIMANFLDTTYSLVHQDNSADQPSVQELKTQLEKGSDETKVETLKRILSIMLNGDPMTSLLMHIIRFVMPSKSKPLKKLLYLYYEICPKLDNTGKLRQEWILVWCVYQKCSR